ncbi:uncharacterized protein [Antedon mediterranea]|uniref:uncharacterized protein n=1 Tax=Antedon mediterranea TaxID=105859 RepID=UPI003AF67209
MSFKVWATAFLSAGVVSEVLYMLYMGCKSQTFRDSLSQARTYCCQYFIRMFQRNHRRLSLPAIEYATLSDNGTRPSSQLNIFHEVHFFPESHEPCKHHFWGSGCTNSNCRFSHKVSPFVKLTRYVQSAKKSIDVCVYTLSNKVILNILIELHKKGVVVRVITDDESINLSGNHIGNLRKNGIDVRTDLSSFLMHHKFIIIDGIVLLNGSLNWTRHAILGNNENVLVTNEPLIVHPYKGEFEKLWELFNPVGNAVMFTDEFGNKRYLQPDSTETIDL